MRRAFTLIELLVVIAIIAILAAILFPVFAQAKTAAKVAASTSGIKQISTALHTYSADFDDMTVPHYGTSYQDHNTWVGRIYPYVKNKSIFFDPLMPEPGPDKGDDYYDPFYGYDYKWEWITNFSLNVDGYSAYYGGTSCATYNYNQERGSRSLSSFSDPSARLVVAPTRYADLKYSWMRFYATNASWPLIDRYASGWDWNQLIWDARRQYPGPKFVGAFADGHAGKFGREKFVGRFVDSSKSEAKTFTQWCGKMDEKKLWDFWGRPWGAD